MRCFAVACAAAILISGAALAETIERTVQAGGRSVVGAMFTYWIETCFQAEIPDVTVSQRPKNGTAAVERHTLPMPKGHPCAGKTLSGPVVLYQPAKGFKGVDEFSVQYPFSNNDTTIPTMRSSTYRVTVQ